MGIFGLVILSTTWWAVSDMSATEVGGLGTEEGDVTRYMMAKERTATTAKMKRFGGCEVPCDRPTREFLRCRGGGMTAREQSCT